MKNKDKIEIRKIDETTFNIIQKIKEFVDFVCNLDFATTKNKIDAKEIKYIIDNINNPETYKDWNVCLDIFDYEIQDYSNKKNGFYWRKWSIFFENDSLEIEAASKHTACDLGHYGDDFYYFRKIHFRKETKMEPVYMNVDIREFIQDAKNYKKYITESLNNIEIDIDVDR